MPVLFFFNIAKYILISKYKQKVSANCIETPALELCTPVRCLQYARSDFCDTPVEQILSDLIRINTVNPREMSQGSPLSAGTFAAQELTTKLSNQKKANFMARIGTVKKLLFLSHSDVVPAGEGWDFDPFGGEIAEGMVYGRGALDCKGLMAHRSMPSCSWPRKPLP